MSAKPRILVLSHSASRNGASIVLLHFLKWLNTVVDWNIDILVDGHGPLLDEFRCLGRTRVRRNPAVFLRILPRPWQAALEPYVETLYLKTLFLGRRFDLIYANSADTWLQVNALKTSSNAFLWHIHELPYSLRLSIPDDRAKKVFRVATRFVAASTLVRDTLANEYEVPDDRVDLVHEFIPECRVALNEKRARRLKVTEKFGWPEQAFVIGGCGGLGWRKGTDLFLQIARIVCSSNGDSLDRVRFLWVGGDLKDRAALEFDHDVRALGLEGRCSRVPTTADVLDYYLAMDVFALTSREDPFPLVMLEAAMHGVPIVCFEGSGGGPEFVGSDAGLTAPYLNVLAFGEQLLRLFEDPNLRERLGESASQSVRACYSLNNQAPKLLQAIGRCLPARNGSVD
jgi:glycosyltransferase involved in cell wall biosynthesis